MTEQKYTQEGLPVVSEDTVEIYILDLEKRLREGSFEEFSEELETKLERENPNLILIREHYAKKGMNEEELEIFGVGFCTLYHLLVNQLNMNKLEKVYQD